MNNVKSQKIKLLRKNIDRVTAEIEMLEKKKQRGTIMTLEKMKLNALVDEKRQYMQKLRELS